MDSIRPMAEQATRVLARRWPHAYLGQALSFQIVDVLGPRVDTETRLARLPGGARLVVTLRDYALRELYFRGSRTTARGWLYEPETTRFIFKWLRPGDTFVDIGANAGYYTAIAGSIVGPSGRVHAFEPNPVVVTLLQKTVEVNRYQDRTDVNPLAVTSTGTPVEIFRPLDPGATGATTTVPLGSELVLPGLTVPSITLDAYVEMKEIQTIRLMKIDVEGAELDVLAGALRTLEIIQPEGILCEFCPRLLPDPERAWKRLLADTGGYGYQPSIVSSSGELTSWDGRMPAWTVGNVCLTLPGA